MPYRVEIKNSAATEIRKLERISKRRVLDRLDRLKENPRGPGTSKLKGYDDLYRIRSGSFRIIFQIDDILSEILVVKVADRRDVYD
jgi:mRNA interferase RelE/StbE